MAVVTEFFFAWVGESETFGPQHYRMDEDVFSFQLEQLEAEWCSLVVEIVNPRQGLLNPTRDLWCYLACKTDAGTVTPLFKGRVVGSGDELASDTIKVSFIASASDYEERLEALAATLRTLPGYDPLWISDNERMKAPSVLEGRTALFHIDPVTHAVTISDLVSGEAGLIDFGSNIFEGETQLTHRAPISCVDVTASVSWKQQAAGTVDISQRVRSAFGGGVASYTGDGLRKDWPRKGDRIGAGWTHGDTTLVRTNGQMSAGRSVIVNGKPKAFPLWTFSMSMAADYEIERDRTETMKFKVFSDIQPLLTDPYAPRTETVVMSTSDADQPIDPGGLYPVRDTRQNTFFKSDRGKQSLAYLLNMARAKLIASARAIDITFSVPFEDALGISLRHSARIEDPRLPGGAAMGKVTGYTLSLDGSDGALLATVTISCMIGHGGSHTADPGEPSYADDDYVEDDYQTFTAALSLIGGGDLGYTSFDNQPIHDDGIDLFNMSAGMVQSVTVDGTVGQQVAATARPFADDNDAFTALNDKCTIVGLQMRPLKGGPFLTEYNIDVTDLRVPKTIDLEN